MKTFKRPSPSMAVALLALFIAIGGTATAAKVLITSSSQIKNGAVARADIAPNAVNGARVQDGTLRAEDLAANATKALGGVGPKTYEVYRAAGPVDRPPGSTATVATLRDLPAGAYAIFASTVLTAPSTDNGILDPGQSVGGRCVVDADGDTAQSQAFISSPGASNPSGISAQLTRVVREGSTVKLDCDVANANWRASDTSIIAIQIDSELRQSVEG